MSLLWCQCCCLCHLVSLAVYTQSSTASVTPELQNQELLYWNHPPSRYPVSLIFLTFRQTPDCPDIFLHYADEFKVIIVLALVVRAFRAPYRLGGMAIRKEFGSLLFANIFIEICYGPVPVGCYSPKEQGTTTTTAQHKRLPQDASLTC